MQNEKVTSKVNEQFWMRIAWIAGIFSCVICILLIANYIQIKKADPINMKVINALVERLTENPNDSQLRDEIRTLDLLSRKAYFTNQWQIRTGGYLLLIGVAVFIIAMQVINMGRKKLPVLSDEAIENTLLNQQNSRKWVMYGGGGLLAITIAFAILSHNELKIKFSQAAVTNSADAEGKMAQDEVSVDSLSNKQVVADSSLAQNGVVSDSVQGDSELDSKDNFPTFRGQGGYGIVRQKNVPLKWNGKTGSNVLWKVAIPLQGFNSPVIWGSKIFLTGASATKREVYCIDRNTGKILWATPIEKVKGSPAQSPKVNSETGQAAPTAATDGKAVYAIFANGDIAAVDMTGKILWAQNLGDPQNHYGHSSSLMLYKDLVIVQYDQRNSPKLIALSTLTGKTVWSTPRKVKISWASPILVNTGKRMEIIVAAEPYVSGYNPATGQELWQVDCISGEVGPSVAYANGMVFSVNDYSKLAAIKLGDKPEVVWENNDYLSDAPSPVATDKYLILATSYGTVVCYDSENGTKYWEKEFPEGMYSSPVIAEGKVYMMDKAGVMHIFKADKEYASVAENPLGEKSVCTPAFTNGRIYLRGDKNLYCIGK